MSSHNVSQYARNLAECFEKQSIALNSINTYSPVSIVSLAARGHGEHAIDDISDYSPFQLGVVGAYAESKGYNFRTHQQLPVEIAMHQESDFRWNKIPLLILAFDTWAKESKYIVWIDSDAIVTDFNFDIESLAQQHQNAEILASADIRLGLINTGFIIFRNSAWSRQFLSQWWTISDRNLFCDQDAFDMVYKQLAKESQEGTDKFRQKVRILSMNALNTHPPAWKYHSEGDRVLHLMGEAAVFRALVFADGYRSICKARSGGFLPPQLGITQESMKMHGQRVYRDATQRTFALANETGSLHDIEELSKASHHYVDLLQDIASQKQKDPITARSSLEYLEEIFHIRQGVFALILEHLKLLRGKLQAAEGEGFTTKQRMDIMQHLVSLLKKAAEAGNSLFWATHELENRKLVGQQVLNILDELLSRVIDEHKPRPLHMRALMFQNLGVTLYEKAMQHSQTDLKRNNFVKQSLFIDAEVYLRQSIRIFDEYWMMLKQLASKGAASVPMEVQVRREYIQSIQLHAGVLCLLRRFAEGVGEWQQAIVAAENAVEHIRLGPDYEKLGLIYYNAAVCHAEYGNILSNDKQVQETRKDLEVLEVGYRMSLYSTQIVTDIIAQQTAGQFRDTQQSNPEDSSVLPGYDEISDLVSFSRQVQSLKERISQKLRSLGKEPIPTSIPNELLHKEVEKKYTEPILPPKQGPKQTMKRVILPSGEVKYTLSDEYRTRFDTGSLKDESNAQEQDEDDEWEECTELDDANCLSFEVEEIGSSTVSLHSSTASADLENTSGANYRINSSQIQEVSPMQRTDHSVNEDEYDDYYDDHDYYYDDDDLVDNNVTDSGKTNSSAGISDYAEDASSLYQGLEAEDISDLVAARERHRRQFENCRLDNSVDLDIASKEEEKPSTDSLSLEATSALQQRLNLIEKMLLEVMDENLHLKQQLELLQKENNKRT
jgi:hypothetical protein